MNILFLWFGVVISNAWYASVLYAGMPPSIMNTDPYSTPPANMSKPPFPSVNKPNHPSAPQRPSMPPRGGSSMRPTYSNHQQRPQGMMAPSSPPAQTMVATNSAHNSSYPSSNAEMLQLSDEKDGSLVKGTAEVRKQLVHQATVMKTNADQSIEKIEKAKKEMYNQYLQLDKQIDDFYMRLGSTRGEAATHLDVLKEKLVETTLTHNKATPDDSAQNKVDSTESLFSSFEQEARSLQEEENKLLNSLTALSTHYEQALSALQSAHAIESSLKNLARDEEAQQAFATMQQHYQSIFRIEQEVSAVVTPQLSNAMNQLRGKLQQGMLHLGRLEEKGISLREHIARLEKEQESLPKKEVLPKVSNEKGAPSQEEGGKKKLLNHTSRSFFDVSTKAFQKIKSVAKVCAYYAARICFTLFIGIKDVTVFLLSSLFGLHSSDESLYLLKDTMSEDAVYASLDKERNRLYSAIRSSIQERSGFEAQLRRLDIVEAEYLIGAVTSEEVLKATASLASSHSKEEEGKGLAYSFLFAIYKSFMRMMTVVKLKIERGLPTL